MLVRVHVNAQSICPDHGLAPFFVLGLDLVVVWCPDLSSFVAMDEY